MSLTILGYVALGSALGGMARVWVVNRVTARPGGGVPLGTLVVNLSGALLVGLLAGALPGLRDKPMETGYVLLIAGLLGSYTTASSFILQTLALLRARRPGPAALNGVVTLFGCVLLAGTGYLVALYWTGAL